MTNNEKLIIIQRKLGLRAENIATATLSSVQTVYGWRQPVDSDRHRGMRDQPYKLLTDWLIQEGKASSIDEINALLQDAA